jgi:hypothetical protein
MNAREPNVGAATARTAMDPHAPAHEEPRDHGPATGSDRARQLLNVLGALAQVGASWWVATAGTDDFARPTPGGDPPTTPAGYAFSIWGPIFAGSIAYALRQALPRQAARPLFRRMGWHTALAFLATAAWPLVAQRREWVWATVAIFLVIAWGLGAAVRAMGRDASLAGIDRWLVRAPLSLFLGWSSIAVFANVGLALRWSGITRPGGETVVALALLVAATAVAAWVTLRTRGNAWFAGAVAWGTAAIAMADLHGMRRAPDHGAGVAALVATAAVIATLVVAWMRRRRDPWQG